MLNEEDKICVAMSCGLKWFKCRNWDNFEIISMQELRLDNKERF